MHAACWPLQITPSPTHLVEFGAFQRRQAARRQALARPILPAGPLWLELRAQQRHRGAQRVGSCLADRPVLGAQAAQHATASAGAGGRLAHQVAEVRQEGGAALLWQIVGCQGGCFCRRPSRWAIAAEVQQQAVVLCAAQAAQLTLSRPTGWWLSGSVLAMAANSWAVAWKVLLLSRRSSSLTYSLSKGSSVSATCAAAGLAVSMLHTAWAAWARAGSNLHRLRLGATSRVSPFLRSPVCRTCSSAWLAASWPSFFCSARHSHMMRSTGLLPFPGSVRSSPWSSASERLREVSASAHASRTALSASCGHAGCIALLPWQPRPPHMESHVRPMVLLLCTLWV